MSEFRIDNNLPGVEKLKEKRITELKELGKKYLSSKEFLKLEDSLNSFAGKEPDEDFLKNWEEKVNSALEIKSEEAEEYAKSYGEGQLEEGREEI